MNDQPAAFDLNQELLKEKKAARKWRNIRFFGWIFILLVYAVLIFGPTSDSMTGSSAPGPYVSLVRLNGVIAAGKDFSALNVTRELTKAFRDKESKGVILLVNSPGGSPVQAGIIHDKILQLKKKYNKKVVVVGEDALASGSYMVAVAADKIYVNADSLVGSIGVIMGGFGFPEVMEKVGITRRVFTAGSYKDRLDPFEKLKPEDVEKVKKLLAIVHQNFIAMVKQGRGDRLKGDPAELFSGDFWTGKTAVKLGLVDGTANVWTVMQDEFGVKHYRDYTRRAGFLQKFIGDVGATLSLHLMENASPLQAKAF